MCVKLYGKNIVKKKYYYHYFFVVVEKLWVIKTHVQRKLLEIFIINLLRICEYYLLFKADGRIIFIPARVGIYDWDISSENTYLFTSLVIYSLINEYMSRKFFCRERWRWRGSSKQTWSCQTVIIINTKGNERIVAVPYNN